MTVQNFINADAFAFQAHAGQLRKGALKLPYITHPLEVTNILAANGFKDDYDILAAAMLHDVVEDCGVTIDEIKDLFGPIVAARVQEVSWPAGTTKGYKIATAFMLSHAGAAIKVADLISNINSITEDPTSMSRAGAYEYVRYAVDFKMALRYDNPELNRVFDEAVLNFNLNYKSL